MGLTVPSRKLKLGDSFFVQTGDYAGQLFTFVKYDGDNLCFFSAPNMNNINVTKEKFDFAIKNDIIEYKERLPRNVRKVIEAQYEKNETFNFRRQ